MCPPCVRHMSAPAFAICLESPLAAPPNFVRHVSALPFVHHVPAKALALPLDFARSWPAVGQGRGIIRQNSFAPLRNPQRLVSFIYSFLPTKFGLHKCTLCLKSVWGLCWYHSPSSLLWGSRLGKKASCDMLWPRSRILSAMCPPCVRFARASKPCPACVRHVSTLCPPCVRFGHASKPCPAYYVPQLSVKCLPCVCFGRASAPCHASFPCCVRHVSALCPLWLCRHVSVRPPNLVSAMRPSVSAMCPLLVFSLSSLCPLVVRSLSARCRSLPRSMVWLWPSLCQLYVRSFVFVPLSVLCPLLSALVEVFVFGLAAPLLAVRLVTFSRHCPCLPWSFAAHLHPVFCLPPFVRVFCICVVIVCLGFVCVRIFI